VTLDRFVRAQDRVYERVLAELRAGDKRSHWMWFVFPQIAGLGNSPTAREYAISSLDEAKAYLAHPVLGPRLIECAELVRASRTPRSSIVNVGKLRRRTVAPQPRADSAQLAPRKIRYEP